MPGALGNHSKTSTRANLHAITDQVQRGLLMVWRYCLLFGVSFDKRIGLYCQHFISQYTPSPVPSLSPVDKISLNNSPFSPPPFATVPTLYNPLASRQLQVDIPSLQTYPLSNLRCAPSPHNNPLATRQRHPSLQIPLPIKCFAQQQSPSTETDTSFLSNPPAHKMFCS